MDCKPYEPSSMAELQALLDQMRPVASKEEYEVMELLFGVLPNQGESEPVEISGKAVLIDRSIAPIIQSLVQAGVPTLACCSGVLSEHASAIFAPSSGYLSLSYDPQAFAYLQDALKNPLLSVSKSKCYFQSSIHIHLKTTDTEELRGLWEQVHAAVLQAF